MILDSDLCSVVIQQANLPLSSNPTVVACFVDVPTNSLGIVPDVTGTILSTIAETTIVAAPASLTARKVENIDICNNDAVPNIFTVKYNNNAQISTVIKATLYPKDTLHYSYENGWVIRSSGISPVNGGLIAITVLRGLTSSSGANSAVSTVYSIYPRTSATKIKVRLLGAGGGGGAGSAGAGAAGAGAGGGGAAGNYTEKTINITPGMAILCTVGGNGGGGSAGGAGGDGGASIVSVGSITVTAFGGKAGAGMNNITAPAFSAGGLPSTVGATPGDIQAIGQAGFCGTTYVTTGTGIVISGTGGNPIFGGSGIAGAGGLSGNSGIAPGAGGAGGSNTSGGGASGGSGASGVIIIEEYA